MISVAALFSANGVTFTDEDYYLVFDCPALQEPLRIAKDGYSDNYRLQEAVERKVKGGNGMILLPDLSCQVTVPAKQKWEFKEQYDSRHNSADEYNSSGETLWGGSFLTKAMDYDNDVEYAVLDLGGTPHYYNILLTARERKDFGEANPGLSYVECKENCLPRVHYHGVHGVYPEANLGIAKCAPAFDLLEEWVKLPMLDPLLVKADAETASRHAPVTERGAAARPVERSEKSPEVNEKIVSGKKKSKKTAGASTLQAFVENCPPWSEVQETYRTPEAAKWADTGLYASSNSGQRKLKQKWNALYTERVLPMLGGKGAPVQSVLKRAWDLDNDHKKVISNYIVRRLISGDSCVVETADGMLVAQSD